MLMIAVMSVAMTSCDDWDSPYYVDDVVGAWESYYGYDGYGEYDLIGTDVVRYEFYANYTGRYYCYNGMRLTYFNFEWDTNGSRIKIWYEDGDFDNLYYGFNDYGFLVLSHSKRFYEYTVYRPAGRYYEQGKSIDPTQAKKFDPAIDKRPETAAVKQ